VANDYKSPQKAISDVGYGQKQDTGDIQVAGDKQSGKQRQMVEQTEPVMDAAVLGREF
jgi:hypothetical protein